MKKEIIIAALAIVAIVEFFAIVIFLGIITPVLLTLASLAIGILFPMVITRYTGGLICLGLADANGLSDRQKTLLMNTFMILGVIVSTIFLRYSFLSSAGDDIDMTKYFSMTDFIGISIIGSIIGIVLVNKVKLARHFMNFF